MSSDSEDAGVLNDEEMQVTGYAAESEDFSESDGERQLPFGKDIAFTPLTCEVDPPATAKTRVAAKPRFTRLFGPYETFLRFFTDNILDEFLKYTLVENLNRGELRVFFGMMMLFGLTPKRRLRDHWSADLGSDEIKRAMPRERFEEIWGALKIYDGSSDPDDPRKHVLKLIELVSHNFRKNLTPGRDKSVDEIMEGYFGKRCSQTFFIPRNPSKKKNGLKFQGIADAQLGYMWVPDDVKPLCTPTGVIDHFVANLRHYYGVGGGHHIYADKWYTSIEQALRCIKEHGVHFTGTLSKNRAPGAATKDPRTKRMVRGKSFS